jgi:hypothetical protein
MALRVGSGWMCSESIAFGCPAVRFWKAISDPFNQPINERGRAAATEPGRSYGARASAGYDTLASIDMKTGSNRTNFWAIERDKTDGGQRAPRAPR